jgi:alginate O-acetyltransferase complex protein AlgI
MGCLSSGVLSVVLMAHLGVGMLLPLFVGMSVAFHYGVLRLLVAFWRWCGRPVRVLFRNPLKMQGFADFWGKRWNLAYSQMMAIAVMRPLLDSFGKRPAQFGVFVISGLLHELAITVPVGAGYGWPTLFFVLQGMFTVSEVRASRVMAALCGLSLVVGLPMLFPEAFVEAVIYPARDFLKLS